MTPNPLNRSLVMYAVIQSSFVMIALAATLLMQNILQGQGIITHRMWVALPLVIFTQLPVALLYVRSEIRCLTSAEGWMLAFCFVGLTAVFELGLQGLIGSASAPSHIVTLLWTNPTEQTAGLICGFLVLGIVVGFLAKFVFDRATLGNIHHQPNEARLDGFDVLPGLRRSTGATNFYRPKAWVGYGALFKTEMLAANGLIVGLAFLAGDMAFLQILLISVPMSLVFSLLCVANRLARATTRDDLSQRCLKIALALAPLTVACLLITGLSTLYLDYMVHTAGWVQPVDYLTVLSGHLSHRGDVLQTALIGFGLLFSVVLAANTLFLWGFVKLIRPLVAKRAGRLEAVCTASVDAPRIEPVLSVTDVVEEPAPRILIRKLGNGTRQNNVSVKARMLNPNNGDTAAA